MAFSTTIRVSGGDDERLDHQRRRWSSGDDAKPRRPPSERATVKSKDNFEGRRGKRRRGEEAAFACDGAVLNSATVKDFKQAIRRKIEVEDSKMRNRHICWYVV
nr:U11/U12 small nuclear ribonucleoprotein 25 kDa protein isoform X1 [Ipomoea batatas]